MDLQLTSDFVLRLTEAQPRILGFLLKRLANRDQAHEVLQEVNLVICRKADEFDSGTDFMAWAFAIARFQVMSFRKKQSRDRLVFPGDLAADLDALDEKLHPVDRDQDRLSALADCMDNLTPQHQDILLRRYADLGSVKSIASELDRSVNAVSIRLHRLRLHLMECVEKRLTGNGKLQPGAVDGFSR